MSAAALPLRHESAPNSEPFDTVLRVEGLAHRYGERQVLHDLSFEVRRGEVFGLLGPNGAGKSTAFHALTGLLLPNAGRITLDGRAIQAGDRALRNLVGVVFQGNSLDLKLSARENLLLASALHGIRGAAAKTRAEELLGWAELSDRAGERVEKFSGGMRRRLEIARALVHRPSLLILDEPTTGLDQTSFQRTWAHLRELCTSERLSILLTTHRPEEAERCDRLGVLNGGRLVTVDTPDRLREQVRGDVLLVEATEPEALAAEIASRFSCHAQVSEGRVAVECEKGHALIPRLVEAFPAGRIAAVSLRRPTLADAFLKVTGRALHGEVA